MSLIIDIDLERHLWDYPADSPADTAGHAYEYDLYWCCMSDFKFKLCVIVSVLVMACVVCSNAWAKADFTPMLQKTLDIRPLDIASSSDGKLIFILSRGKLVVYSPVDNTIVSRSDVDKVYDRISYSSETKTLVLASTGSSLLKLVQIEQIYEISTKNCPAEGPVDAPVTIAVFDDYQ